MDATVVAAWKAQAGVTRARTTRRNWEEDGIGFDGGVSSDPSHWAEGSTQGLQDGLVCELGRMVHWVQSSIVPLPK